MVGQAWLCENTVKAVIDWDKRAVPHQAEKYGSSFQSIRIISFVLCKLLQKYLMS